MNKTFQSLIGILQTHEVLLTNLAPDSFQSLIGILQTGLQEKLGKISKIVSIPHRYSTNMQEKEASHASNYCFNPSQVFYKLNFQFEKKFHFSKFQSLIGILQTIVGHALNQKWGGFQSLIGILQTLLFTASQQKQTKFQSLIGILQTKTGWYSFTTIQKFQSLIGILQTIPEVKIFSLE